MESRRQKTRKLTHVAFLSALIVVLQVLTYFIKAGPFNMSFVLIPIVLGGILYGPEVGAFLGGVFGAVVVVVSVAGLDIGGTLIGMHLKPVAVPLKLSVRQIGDAVVIGARTRPKFVGGSRAVYDENLL